MSSYSRIHTTLVLEALEHYDFSRISHLCDVGGGHGYTLCSLLVKYPHLRGTVLELPSAIAKQELLWADKMGVGDRCTFVPGDMFRDVPMADAYMMKYIIHDWNDEECRQILSIIHRAAPRMAQIPPDLVVKSQVTDIIEIIVQPIGPPNSVHRAYRYRKSRGELLSTSEVPWSTTKSDGVWEILIRWTYETDI